MRLTKQTREETMHPYNPNKRAQGAFYNLIKGNPAPTVKNVVMDVLLILATVAMFAMFIIVGHDFYS